MDAVRFTTVFNELGREGRSGAVDVDEAAVDVAAGAAEVVVVGVITEEAVVDADNVFPPAAAPALSHGLGGETDAISVSEIVNQRPRIEIDSSEDN